MFGTATLKRSTSKTLLDLYAIMGTGALMVTAVVGMCCCMLADEQMEPEAYCED